MSLGNTSKDKALFMSIVGLLIIVGGGVTALGASPTPSNPITPNCSYFIQYNLIGTIKHYYAINCNTQILSFGNNGFTTVNNGGADSLNFTDVMQHAVNALQCGNIELAVQLFNATHGFKMYPCVSLTSKAGTGDFGTQPNTSTIFSTDCLHPIIMMEVNPNFTKYQVFPAISAITLSAKGSCATTQDGIFVNETNGAILDITLSYVRIFAMGGNCINAGTTNAHFWIDNTYLEDCHANGITGKGNIFISNSYIFGNSLYGVNHITGSGFNSFHDFYINNVQSAVFCANVNNQCNSQDDIIQNNGGASFAQFSVATSNSPTANPTVISGDTFTDSRTSSNAAEQINFEATLVNSNVEGNYFWSANNVNCFKFLAGGYIAGGSLGNVLITGNQGSCNNITGKVTGNFVIGGTSATTKHYIGAFGMNSTTVIASQLYTASNTNQYVSCSGGTGVNITIIDPNGNVIETLGTCLTTVIDLPVGWSINFGAFVVAPTVIDYVKNI